MADEWQGFGIATQLLRELITVAEHAGIERLEGLVLRENGAMLKFAKELGFTTECYPDDATVVRVVRNLAVSDYCRLPVTTLAMANDRLAQ